MVMCFYASQLMHDINRAECDYSCINFVFVEKRIYQHTAMYWTIFAIGVSDWQLVANLYAV